MSDKDVCRTAPATPGLLINNNYQNMKENQTCYFSDTFDLAASSN